MPHVPVIRNASWSKLVANRPRVGADDLNFSKLDLEVKRIIITLVDIFVTYASLRNKAGTLSLKL